VTTGVEIRAQIDSENVKGLLLISGGAAIALLAFLPQVIGKTDFRMLAYAILVGLLVFSMGLLSAVVHNSLRRQCSLEYERHNYSPPHHPKVCKVSTWFKWVSLAAFVLGALVVFAGGVLSLLYATP
jgi:hypothetical protein